MAISASMTKILSCTVSECAYNISNECHTMAITVGSDHPACDTFYKSSSKGGAPDFTGGVGACRVENCTHNKTLECSASGINVGPHAGHADCRTFAAR